MNIVIFDTETTGIDSEKDRLVEIAGVDIDRAYPHFTTLVNPQRDIPPEARAIHHIGPADVEHAPDEQTSLRSMLNHFGDVDVLAAHNAKFDAGFVARIAPILSIPYICTYKCALTAWPDAPKHSNQVLRYWLGLALDAELPIDLFPHRALYDAIVTRGILAALLRTYSVPDLIHISANPVLLKRMTFGKHAGDLWSDIPYGYLKWVTSQSDMNEDVLFTARHWMRR